MREPKLIQMTADHAIKGNICFIRKADDAADDVSDEECTIIGMVPKNRGHSRTDVRLTRTMLGSDGMETDETVTMKVKDLWVMEEVEEDSASGASGDDSAAADDEDNDADDDAGK